MVVLELVAALLGLIVAAWLQHLWKFRKMRKIINGLPGPRILPVLGNSFEFLGSNKDIMTAIMTLPEKYPPPSRMLMGDMVYVVVSSPSDIQAALNNSKALKKPMEYDFLKPLLRNGIFTSSGATWKKHRRLLMPTFNQKILNSFVEVFLRQSETLVHQLEKRVGAGTFDIFPHLSAFSVDSVCETTMGVEMKAQAQESPFLHWVNKALEVSFKRMFHIWLRSDIVFSLTPYAKQEKENVENTQKYIDEIIKKKEEDSKTPSNEESNESDSPKWKSTLDLMLELLSSDSGFTREDLRDEVTTIVMAGSDTTAVSLGFTLIMLGMHPEIQEMVYREVVDVLGPDGKIHSEDLKSLQYTERVLKETLRIFPPGHLVGRVVEEDLHLESCTVPAGCGLVAVIITLHRNPEIYPEPMKFDPDRFLPEEVAKRHPSAWIPFSAGPRNCIGFNYAMMQMKTTVAYLIRRYRFGTPYESTEKLELKADLLLKPLHGCLVSVELRN